MKIHIKYKTICIPDIVVNALIKNNYYTEKAKIAIILTKRDLLSDDKFILMNRKIELSKVIDEYILGMPAKFNLIYSDFSRKVFHEHWHKKDNREYHHQVLQDLKVLDKLNYENTIIFNEFSECMKLLGEKTNTDSKLLLI